MRLQWEGGFPKAPWMVNAQHTDLLSVGPGYFLQEPLPLNPLSPKGSLTKPFHTRPQAGIWLPRKDTAEHDVCRTRMSGPYFALALVPVQGHQTVGLWETAGCSVLLQWLHQLLKEWSGNLDSQHKWSVLLLSLLFSEG